MKTTIPQAEESIQDALESLRSVPTTDQIKEVVRSFLAPDGFHPVVELRQDGHKKRRDASLSNWSPEKRQILISFSLDTHAVNHDSVKPSRKVSAPHPTEGAAKEVSPEQELCQALEEAERQGRSFVALKWFRDEVLPSRGFQWAMTPEARQAVLARAIESGAVLTSKIPNPRSPFPTTTIRLNRTRAAGGEARRRFSPIRISGEPLSATILHDRGAR